MVIKSVNVLSAAVVMGCLYACMGLIAGAVMSLIAMAGAAAQMQSGEGPTALVMGVGAVILMPILYGIGGFIGGLIMAVIYNVIAGLTGGLKLKVEMEPGASSAAPQY